MTHREIILVAVLAAAGCSQPADVQPDVRIVEVDLRLGWDEVNTFEGTMTKDLVLDGLRTVPFRFTRAEQESILARAERLDFFAIPPVIEPPEGVAVSPDPGEQRLRIRQPGRDHTVVWRLPLDTTRPDGTRVIEFSLFIIDLVRNSPAWTWLPAPRGGRL